MPSVDDGGVFEALAGQLRSARRRGNDFSHAWPAAREHALAARPLRPREREAWLKVLGATRAAWARAYAGEPATAADVAAVRLRDAILDEVERERGHDVLVA